jgi:hypothetical protein
LSRTSSTRSPINVPAEVQLVPKSIPRTTSDTFDESTA